MGENIMSTRRIDTDGLGNLTGAGRLLALLAVMVTFGWGILGALCLPLLAPMWRLVGIIPGLIVYLVGSILLALAGIPIYKSSGER